MGGNEKVSRSRSSLSKVSKALSSRMGSKESNCIRNACKITNLSNALPIKNLPINNTAKISYEIARVDSSKFDVSKFAVVNASSDRVVQLWDSYKKVISVEGDEYKKFSVAVEGLECLAHKLRNSPESVGQEIHECIKVRGEMAQFLIFAIKPGTYPQTYHSIFCFIEADTNTSPEQFTAFMINNGTVGYYEEEERWMYMLEDGEGPVGTEPRITFSPENSTVVGGYASHLAQKIAALTDSKPISQPRITFSPPPSAEDVSPQKKLDTRWEFVEGEVSNERLNFTRVCSPQRSSPENRGRPRAVPALSIVRVVPPR